LLYMRLLGGFTEASYQTKKMDLPRFELGLLDSKSRELTTVL
jgi:hypothetical protein